MMMNDEWWCRRRRRRNAILCLFYWILLCMRDCSGSTLHKLCGTSTYCMYKVRVPSLSTTSWKHWEVSKINKICIVVFCREGKKRERRKWMGMWRVQNGRGKEGSHQFYGRSILEFTGGTRTDHTTPIWCESKIQSASNLVKRGSFECWMWPTGHMHFGEKHKEHYLDSSFFRVLV